MSSADQLGWVGNGGNVSAMWQTRVREGGVWVVSLEWRCMRAITKGGGAGIVKSGLPSGCGDFSTSLVSRWWFPMKLGSMWGYHLLTYSLHTHSTHPRSPSFVPHHQTARNDQPSDPSPLPSHLTILLYHNHISKPHPSSAPPSTPPLPDAAACILSGYQAAHSA